MSNCDICQMIEKKESFRTIYEDDDIIAILHEAPAFSGHTLVIPKKHYRIIEEVPDEITSNIFNISNKISTALFESLNIQGTNILVNNGPEAAQSHPHFMVNIIPRTEKDGINFEWPMTQADFNKLESTAKFLKDFVEGSIYGSQETKAIKQDHEVIVSDADDYMIKQFKRIP